MFRRCQRDCRGPVARRKTPMQVRSEETRTRILQSALRLFSETGLRRHRRGRRSAAPPGVSKGAFYHHFETKQSVFLQLLEDWLRQLDARPAGRAAARRPPCVDGLLGMAARTRGVFSAADGRLSILLEFWGQARKDPVVWERAIAPFRRYRDMFAEHRPEGHRRGLAARPSTPTRRRRPSCPSRSASSCRACSTRRAPGGTGSSRTPSACSWKAWEGNRS